jgi:hypothetical protein
VNQKILIVCFLFSAVFLCAQTEKSSPALYVHGSAGIGSGMYVGGGVEYLAGGAADFMPLPVLFGGMGSVRYVPSTGNGYSGFGIDLMGTVHYHFSGLPRLDLFLGTGFGLIYYTDYGDKEPTLSPYYITFALTLAAAWELTDSLAVTAGVASYPGEFLCASAGARFKI